MIIWKKTKKRNYGLNLFRQDVWGKYGRKRSNNQRINKYERFLKYEDDLKHRSYTIGSSVNWLFNNLVRRREGLKIELKEKIAERSFRTRKILQYHFPTLNFHHIKIHLKKAGIKNGWGYYINFMKQLERRLDVVCVRAHFFKSLREAKQFIKNGNVVINNQIIKSCHYILKDKDILSVKEDLRLTFKKQYLDNLLDGQILRYFPSYLKLNLIPFTFIFVQELFDLTKIPQFTDFPWARFPNLRKTP